MAALELPAFVQQGKCWIMPASSPWAANTTWKADAASRILRMTTLEAAGV
ncbi:MAG: hypothetical protein ABI883_05625 [Chthoniobacterales bacterium]